MNNLIKKAMTEIAGNESGNGTDTASATGNLGKFEKHFETLLTSNNFPGTDYFEYCKMHEALEAHIPEEGKRRVAVFDSLKVQGVGKEDILKSAEQYKSILERDREAFQKAADSKAETEVKKRNDELESIKSKVEKNKAQIEQLSTENKQLQERMVVLANEVNENDSRIKSSLLGYNSASQAILTSINNDILKIKSA